jgi:hypothetical protein
VVVSCKLYDTPSGSIKFWEFLEKLSDDQLSTKDFAP